MTHDPDSQTEARYHHGDLRRALLDAVEDIVRADGLEGLSLRACARHAGVSPGAPAHHFGDKQGLLTEFALEGFAKLRDSIGAELQRCGPTGRERVIAVGRGYIRTALHHPEHFRVMFRKELLDHGDERFEQTRSFTALLEALESIDVDAGREPRRDLDRAMAAWSAVHGYCCLVLDAHTEAKVGLIPDVEEGMRRAEPLLAWICDGILSDSSGPCAADGG